MQLFQVRGRDAGCVGGCEGVVLVDYEGADARGFSRFGGRDGDEVWAEVFGEVEEGWDCEVWEEEGGVAEEG